MKTKTKMKVFKQLMFLTAVAIFALTSCTTMNQSIREANILIELNKDDFEFSEQVIGRAQCTQIFGIDFKRLFKKERGNTIPSSISSEIGSEQRSAINMYYNLPIIGQVLGDKTANYALYNMFSENKGYDVIFYPQYKIQVEKPLLFGFIVKKTKVQVTARMAKLKE